MRSGRFVVGPLFLGAALVLAPAIARAQDKPAPPPDEAKPAASKPAEPPQDKPADKPEAKPADKPADKPGGDAKEAPKAEAKAAKQRPPEPAKAAPAGEALPPGTVARQNLYPLDEGRRWTYELKVWLELLRDDAAKDEPLLDDGPRVQRFEARVGDAQAIDSKSARVVDYLLDGELIQRQFFFEEADGVFCARRVQGIGEHAKDTLLIPPQRVLAKELGLGQKWEWKGKLGATGGTSTYEVLREERVKVRAGQFDCLVIKATAEADDESRAVRVQWLAPNVGLVREEIEVRTAAECWRTVGELLRSEGPKKKP